MGSTCRRRADGDGASGRIWSGGASRGGAGTVVRRDRGACRKILTAAAGEERIWNGGAREARGGGVAG
jgi:hypothetical protein